jgi:hypothetical protein
MTLKANEAVNIALSAISTVKRARFFSCCRTIEGLGPEGIREIEAIKVNLNNLKIKYSDQSAFKKNGQLVQQVNNQINHVLTYVRQVLNNVQITQHLTNDFIDALAAADIAIVTKARLLTELDPLHSAVDVGQDSSATRDGLDRMLL